MSVSLTARDIGATIKKLRKRRGLTGASLGEKTNISQSKISKIETGTYGYASEAELTSILNILDGPHTIRQQILTAAKTGTAVKQSRIHHQITLDNLALEKAADSVCTFTTGVVPVLLQTGSYRTALLQLLGSTDTTHQLKLTTLRQDELWAKPQKYHLIMLHAALYTRFTGASAHIAQLDRIERMIQMNNFTIGIVPVEAGMPTTDLGSFVMFDDHMGIIGMPTREIQITEAEDILVYNDIFKHLDQLAVYGEEAVTLIRRAVDHFR
jgi:transcriptional regulator with XRE-family HTH domain